MAKLPIKKPLSKEPMVHLKQTGKLPMKIQPKQKPPMTLQTKEKAKSPSTEETLDMTQQEQSPKIQAKALAAKEHVSPLAHRQGLTVQVQIQSPKKKPTDLEKRFQEMQQELLALKAEKSMMIDKGLSSAHEAAKKKLNLQLHQWTMMKMKQLWKRQQLTTALQKITVSRDL